MEDHLRAQKNIRSGQNGDGSAQETSEKQTASVLCPVCNRRLKSITITHVKTHGMTMAEFRHAYPSAPLRSEVTAQKHAKKIRASIEKRFSDPEYSKAWSDRFVQNLQRVHAEATPEQKKEWQKKGVQTTIERYGDERKEWSRRGGLAAMEKHPELKEIGKKALDKYIHSEEGRARMSEVHKEAWASGKMDSMREKNRAHAISGRIPVVFPKSKPSDAEKDFMRLVATEQLPLRFVGDGSLRIPTPGTDRHWRCPDFVSTGEGNKIVLLDLQRAKKPRPGSQNNRKFQEETQAYISAGYAVLRIRVQEMHLPETLDKLKTFLGCR